jgi:hypothetical protein
MLSYRLTDLPEARTARRRCLGSSWPVVLALEHVAVTTGLMVSFSSPNPKHGGGERVVLEMATEEGANPPLEIRSIETEMNCNQENGILDS